MAAPKGNSFWELRGKHGTDKILKSPELFLEDAYEYFRSVDENPWLKSDVLRSGEYAGTIIQIPTQRPYTIQGLCIFLGISQETFSNYSYAPGYEDFFGVCQHVRQIIENNQLEGATVGSYNASIIGRLLGLVDKQDITSKGQSLSLSPEQRDAEIELLKRKLNAD